jgi:hypothetical protein
VPNIGFYAYSDTVKVDLIELIVKFLQWEPFGFGLSESTNLIADPVSLPEYLPKGEKPIMPQKEKICEPAPNELQSSIFMAGWLILLICVCGSK